jgi:hypothetical protein
MALNTTEWGGDGEMKAVLISGRHVLPLLLISLYWVGKGFLTVYQWVFQWVESSRLFLLLKSKDKSLMVWGGLLFLMVAIVLPKTMKPQRYERLTEKWAGVWIKNQSEKGVTVFTDMPRVAYYADGNCEYIDLKKCAVHEVKASMMEQKVSYLVIREQDCSGYAKEDNSLQNDFAEVIRFGQKQMEKIIIYKIIQ